MPGRAQPGVLCVVPCPTDDADDVWAPAAARVGRILGLEI
jgi:hypothetical protein